MLIKIISIVPVSVYREVYGAVISGEVRLGLFLLKENQMNLTKLSKTPQDKITYAAAIAAFLQAVPYYTLANNKTAQDGYNVVLNELFDLLRSLGGAE